MGALIEALAPHGSLVDAFNKHLPRQTLTVSGLREAHLQSFLQGKNHTSQDFICTHPGFHTFTASKSHVGKQ